jgi:L,D-peptidoglycan transpeptidase YkuD (ErfK/YbiS/YcfS/YnhG family)
MRVRTVLSTTAAVIAVAGCAVVVIGLSDSIKPRAAAEASVTSSAPASVPSPEGSVDDATGDSPSAPTSAPSATPSPALTPPTTTSSPVTALVTAAAVPAAGAHSAAPTTAAAPRTTVPPPAPVTGQSLPLGYSTGSASQVITVVAASSGSTTATLQAWSKAPSGGWLKYGPAIGAHVGSAGLTAHASESLSATPIGSFALSRAFGRNANPGTGLPYHQTSPADWWISQSGPLYNTIQTCSGSCAFTQGDPNEHLYYETPYYNYAVVIEYNTAPVVQGAGSAFFLHVTDGAATAGCVAIPQANLVSIMQWLSPSAAPRILIGIG